MPHASDITVGIQIISGSLSSFVYSVLLFLSTNRITNIFDTYAKVSPPVIKNIHSKILTVILPFKI